MIIECTDSRLLIISDLHIGNPFSHANTQISAFLKYAKRERFNLCINGDGFEILQASFANLAGDSIEILNQIRGLLEDGLSVYYVVGNHDIVLEHFLESWAAIQICPFLNLTSGDQRVRIEHGHLYDPMFVKNPDLYEFLTKAAGPLLHIYPDVYYLWSYYQRLKDKYRKTPEGEEESVYHEAAEMLLRRGFDCVVFGHTHKPERVELSNGLYVNSGNWMRGNSYVEIIDGRIELKTWDPRTHEGLSARG